MLDADNSSRRLPFVGGFLVSHRGSPERPAFVILEVASESDTGSRTA